MSVLWICLCVARSVTASHETPNLSQMNENEEIPFNAQRKHIYMVFS